jgi:hypothetical protein
VKIVGPVPKRKDEETYPTRRAGGGEGGLRLSAIICRINDSLEV